MNASQIKANATHDLENVTIYSCGFMGNYIKTECRTLSVAIGRYAQYPSAVHAVFVPKGKRSPRGFVQTSFPSLVIVKGHGHPDPAGIYDGGTSYKTGEVTMSRSKYSSCDDGWKNDFRAMLSAHVAATGAEVIADYHEHNPHLAQERKEVAA